MNLKLQLNAFGNHQSLHPLAQVLISVRYHEGLRIELHLVIALIHMQQQTRIGKNGTRHQTSSPFPRENLIENNSIITHKIPLKPSQHTFNF